MTSTTIKWKINTPKLIGLCNASLFMDLMKKRFKEIKILCLTPAKNMEIGAIKTTLIEVHEP